MKTTRIPENVLAALSAATFDQNEMRLGGTLDRGVYQKLAKIVEAAGGKWNRKAQAHIFDGNAADAIEPLLLTGEIVRPADLGQFDTPEEVAEHVIDLAEIAIGMTVLEPSAGTGNLLRPAQAMGGSLSWCELDPKRAAKLAEEFPRRHKVADFLSIDPAAYKPFDRVVMNPPFAPRQADIEHVTHALRFLKPGGRLVAVMAAGVLFRQNSFTKKFHAALSDLTRDAQFERLPDGAFKASGTSVNTCILHCWKV